MKFGRSNQINYFMAAQWHELIDFDTSFTEYDNKYYELCDMKESACAAYIFYAHSIVCSISKNLMLYSFFFESKLPSRLFSKNKAALMLHSELPFCSLTCAPYEIDEKI